jgi:MOSC domain-containing protein YiiM
MGRVISVNVGLPQELTWKGKTTVSAIVKAPVAGPVVVRALNLDGDRQADLRVHGGPAKAVYAYPAEHYASWRAELPGADLGWGAFGENVTVEGLPLEDGLAIGDRLTIGSAELVVTQPRLPCYKLGFRFRREDMVKRFLASGRTGYYLAVAGEGEVAAGDSAELTARHGEHVPVSEVTRISARDRGDREGAARLAALEALPADWREFFRQRAA